MCLLVGYHHIVERNTQIAEAAARATEQFAKELHDSVSCKGLQACYYYDPLREELDAAFYLPLSAQGVETWKAVRLVLYTIADELIGDNDEYLADCKAVPCNMTRICGAMQPQKHVDPVEDMPVYRSIGSTSSPAAFVLPTIVLPAGSCTPQRSGSKILTLKVGKEVLTDEQIGEKIANGVYRTKKDYNDAMKNACAVALLNLLRENKIPLSHVLDVDDDEVPNGEAMVDFMDQLFPSLLPGHTVLVTVLPMDENGTVKLTGSLSVHLHYPKMPASLPILGVLHPDPDEESGEQTIEEDLVIYSNIDLKLRVFNPLTNDNTKDVKLLSNSAHLDKVFGPAMQPSNPEYRSLLAYYDNEATYSAMAQFQEGVSKQIWASMAEACPDSHIDPACKTLFCANLVETTLPTLCTTFEFTKPPAEQSGLKRAHEEVDQGARAGVEQSEAAGAALLGDAAMPDAVPTAHMKLQAMLEKLQATQALFGNDGVGDVAIAAARTIRPESAFGVTHCGSIRVHLMLADEASRMCAVLSALVRA